jgi:hypothetical protein
MSRIVLGRSGRIPMRRARPWWPMASATMLAYSGESKFVLESAGMAGQ